jgi:hypothetical protein
MTQETEGQTAGPETSPEPTQPVEGTTPAPVEGEEGKRAEAAPAKPEPTEGQDTEADTGEETDADKPKPRKGSKLDRDFGRLSRQRHQDRQHFDSELAVRDREIAELRGEIKGMRGGESQKPAPPAAPKRDAFDTEDDYFNARDQYVLDQAEARAVQRLEREQESRRKADQTATQNQEADKIAASYEERCEAARDKYDDFDDVVNQEVPTWPCTNRMAGAIMESDLGPDIAYHLGTHPDEARRIAQMGEIAQVREIGRLEERIARPSPKPAKTTEAPAPVKPLGGGDVPVTKTEDLPYEQYRAEMNRKEGIGA